MSEVAGRKSWHALVVKPRHERSVALGLRTKGYEEFVPTYKGWHQWSDRVKELELPLFPGYAFCRFDPEWRTGVVSTPGVRSIVSAGRVPAPVPDAEIEALRRVESARLRVEPWRYMEIGERLLIERGPLRGLEGILLTVKGDCRLVVSVALLQRSVAVEIDWQWVRRTSGSMVVATASRGDGNVLMPGAPPAA